MRHGYFTEQPNRLARVLFHGVHGALGVLVVTATLGHVAVAQQSGQQPLKPSDTSSPSATLRSFIDSCNEVYEMLLAADNVRRRDPKYEPVVKRILDCLDLSEVPQYARRHAGSDAAVHLKEVLDRIELPPDEEIPDAETIASAGPGEDFSVWRIPDTRITIARVEEGPRRGEYLFTADTVELAPEFYEAVKQLPYRTTGPEVSEGFRQWYLSEPGNETVAAFVHSLPAWCAKRTLGLAVWQWIGLTLTVLIGLAVMLAAYRIGRLLGRRTRDKSVVRYCVTLFFPIVAMFVPLVFKKVALEYLTIRGNALYIATFAANVVFLLAVLIVLAGAGSRIAELIISSPRIHPRGLDAQLIRIVCRLLSFVAAIVVFLEGGKYLGVPLTTLLASAGVGGLAVALAAQDTLKSLFGSMMILLDKPYRTGERIIMADYDGVVEEIGLRSTKIRLLTGHVVSIPNEDMARSRIENIGRRPHIRRITDLHVPLDTPRVKIEKAVELVRKALENHEGMEPDFPPRVYFNDFNPDSFNIRIIYWYHPPNYWDFLEFSQKLNLEIFRAFEDQNIQFSLPSRITYTDTGSEQRPLELKMVSERDRPQPVAARTARPQGDGA